MNIPYLTMRDCDKMKNMVALMKHTLELEAAPTCPIERTANLLGDSWTILIVRDLMSGAKRFGQLQDSLGSVSPKTLSHRLKMLEHADILTRQAYAEIPPRVEYKLTEKGCALSQVIEAMREFGEQYLRDEF
jgi:DNA-binding HxlR family transcriptional regulator